MSYHARIVETGQELTCTRSSEMGLISRKLLVEVHPDQHIEIEYRPDDVEEVPAITWHRQVEK